MNVFDLFFRPYKEENLEKGEICEAANLLQIGEFQLLQLAYSDRFHRELDETQSDRLFHSYMVEGEIPVWASDYARKILDRDVRGVLNINDPTYHRYDRDYAGDAPKGVWDFAVATACCFAFVFGSVLLAGLLGASSVSMFPPHFERTEVQGSR